MEVSTLASDIRFDGPHSELNGADQPLNPPKYGQLRSSGRGGGSVEGTSMIACIARFMKAH